MTHFAFDLAPDAARARWLDRRMRDQLGHSLAHVDERVTEACGVGVPGLPELVHAMRNGAVYRPAAFGLYYDAVQALQSNEPQVGVDLLAALVAEVPLQSSALRVMSLDHITPPEARERYLRLMDTDPHSPLRMAALSPEAFDTARTQVESTMARMRAVLPELAEEIEALVRELILVTDVPGQGYSFAGGSCYMLWGALFVNAGQYLDDVSMVEVLAHESGHSLLFGLTMDEPLVRNDDSALFSSPLRDDPRPMDGILHATFVSARMHAVVTALIASGQLDVQERTHAAQRQQLNARSFWEGHSVVQAHGELSDTGRLVMDGALRHMQAFA